METATQKELRTQLAQIHTSNELTSLSKDRILIRAGFRIDYLLRIHTGNLNALEPDWNQLQGLTILDLGCGSPISKRSDNAPTYYPWLCYICSAQGANTYGIDIFENPETQPGYTHITTDLAELVIRNNLGTIKELSNTQFDIINSTLVVDDLPPEMARRLKEAGMRPEGLRTNLVIQLEPLIKEGGVLALEHEIYIKQGGKLVKRYEIWARGIRSID